MLTRVRTRSGTAAGCARPRPRGRAAPQDPVAPVLLAGRAAVVAVDELLRAGRKPPRGPDLRRCTAPPAASAPSCGPRLRPLVGGFHGAPASSAAGSRSPAGSGRTAPEASRPTATIPAVA